MKYKTVDQIMAETVQLYAPRKTLSVINERLKSYDRVLNEPEIKSDDWMSRYYQGKYNGLAENTFCLGTTDGKSNYINCFIGTIDSKDWSHYDI